MATHDNGVVALRFATRRSALASSAYYGSLIAASAEYFGPAKWRGKGCGRLGLEGAVKVEDFVDLIYNRRPGSHSQPLTPVTRIRRRVGCDVNFHAVHSVSIMAIVIQDQRLCAAFESACEITLDIMETFTQVRVRNDGANHDRLTGEMVCAHILDFLSRYKDGKADPHLHSHDFWINATYDEQRGEGKAWKAAQMGLIVENAPVFQAIFHSVFARLVRGLGYRLIWDGPRWEIEGVGPEIIELFSRRTREIETAAYDRLMWSDREKAEMGASLRSEKPAEEADWKSLHRQWDTDLGAERLEALRELRLSAEMRAMGPPPPYAPVTIGEAFRVAIESLAGRMAIWGKREFIAAALLAGHGDVTFDQVQTELARVATDAAFVRALLSDGKEVFTTSAIIQDLESSISLATAGAGKFQALGLNPQYSPCMSQRQREAVQQLVSSCDFMTVIRGTGTGARLMYRAAEPALAACGRQLVVLGVRPKQVKMLEKDGVLAPLTVDAFLTAPPAMAKGCIIWVEEAAFVDSAALKRLFERAQQSDARIVLVEGNTYRTSLNYGNAVRLIREGVSLRSIPPAQAPAESKPAINDAPRGEAASEVAPAAPDAKVSRLVRIGREFAHADPEMRGVCAAKKLVALSHSGATCTALAGTYSEALEWTGVIRSEMFNRGDLDATTSRQVEVIVSADGMGEISPPTSLRAPCIEPTFEPAVDGSGTNRTEGTTDTVGGQESAGQTEFAWGEGQPSDVLQTITVAVGDRLRVTRSANLGGHRLIAGEILTVEEHLANGDMRVASDRIIPNGFKHLSYGWVESPATAERLSTSHVVMLTNETTDQRQVAGLLELARGASQRLWVFSESAGRVLPHLPAHNDQTLFSELVRTHSITTSQVGLPAESDVSDCAIGRLPENQIGPAKDNDCSTVSVTPAATSPDSLKTSGEPTLPAQSVTAGSDSPGNLIANIESGTLHLTTDAKGCAAGDIPAEMQPRPSEDSTDCSGSTTARVPGTSHFQLEVDTIETFGDEPAEDPPSPAPIYDPAQLLCLFEVVAPRDAVPATASAPDAKTAEDEEAATRKADVGEPKVLQSIGITPVSRIESPQASAAEPVSSASSNAEGVGEATKPSLSLPGKLVDVQSVPEASTEPAAEQKQAEPACPQSVGDEPAGDPPSPAQPFDLAQLLGLSEVVAPTDAAPATASAPDAETGEDEGEVASKADVVEPKDLQSAGITPVSRIEGPQASAAEPVSSARSNADGISEATKPSLSPPSEHQTMPQGAELTSAHPAEGATYRHADRPNARQPGVVACEKNTAETDADEAHYRQLLVQMRPQFEADARRKVETIRNNNKISRQVIYDRCEVGEIWPMDKGYRGWWQKQKDPSRSTATTAELVAMLTEWSRDPKLAVRLSDVNGKSGEELLVALKQQLRAEQARQLLEATKERWQQLALVRRATRPQDTAAAPAVSPDGVTQAPPPVAPEPVPKIVEQSYHYQANLRQHGAFSLAEIRDLITARVIGPSTLMRISKPGMADWHAAVTFDEFNGAFSAAGFATDPSAFSSLASKRIGD